MKRILALCLCLILCVSAVAIPASAYYVYPISGIQKVGANTSNTTHNYSAYWQYWSQGASKESLMRGYGCRVVAQAKLLVEVGAASGDPSVFNPDSYLEWGRSQGYWLYSTTNLNEQTDSGIAAVHYASLNGINLERSYVSLSGTNSASDVQTVMNYLCNGYYVILHCSAHHAYVGRQISLNEGTPVILDSWYTNSYTPYTVQTYSGYTLNNFVGMYVFKPLGCTTHSYGDWTVTTAPGCETEGTQTHTCTKCGASESQSVPAAGHDWAVSATTAGTCLKPGTTTSTCKNCGKQSTSDSELTWSEWSTTKPSGVNEQLIQTATQYRYSDKESNWVVTETGTVDYVKSWPAGFHSGTSLYSKYNKTPMVSSETDTTRVTVTSDNLYAYLYWHWCRGTYTAGPINRAISDTYGGQFTAFHAFDTTEYVGFDSSANAYYFYNAGCCTDTYWYFQLPIYRQSYTIEEKQFDGERWTDWSQWSTDAVTASDTRKVETRTVYRYVTGGLGEHTWDEGVSLSASHTIYTCTTCGATRDVQLRVENPFTDVAEKDYFYDPVLWAANNGITTGTSDTTFSPDWDCTRGQIVTFLWRAEGCPEPAASSCGFADVKADAYYYKAILWAVEKGITTGYSETAFGPDDVCTRGQIVTFLWRYFGKPAASGANPFTDLPAGGYYNTAIGWAADNGITTGTTPTTFSPDDNCTRGQIVTFLYRAIV